MAHCVYIPSVKNKDGIEIESKLFRDLQRHTQDRELTKALWAMTQVPNIVKTLKGIQYDQNGEVTLESLVEAVDVQALMEGPSSLLAEKRTLKAVDQNNEPILYDTSEGITQKVIEFNKNNQSLVATVNKVGDKYTMDIQNKSNENVKVPGQIEFQNALNNSLLGKMRALGFDVSNVDSSRFNGIFTPQSAQETADGLQVVIKLAEGQQGELAFSEEFSHFMIEGLRHTPLVQRLFDLLNNEAMIREILGDQYDTYNQLYDGNMDRLIKEAAGKLLDLQIRNPQAVQPQSKNLISRIWNYAKNLFRKFTSNDISESIRDAQNQVTQLAESIMDDSVMPLFNKENLLDADMLYQVEKELVNIEMLADEAVKLYAKKLASETRGTRHRAIDSQKLKTLNNLRTLIENKKYASSTINFMAEGIRELSKIQRQLSDPIELDGLEKIDRLRQLNAMAKILNNIREHSDAYSPIISQLQGVQAMLEAGDVNLTAEDAVLIQQHANKISTILSELEVKYKSMQFNTIFNYMSEFWEGDYTMELGGNKGKALSLDMMLRMGEKDIGGWDRYISSLADASDPLLSLVDRIFKENEGTKDEILREFIDEIRAQNQLLVKAGYNTQFMYELDSEGNKTGRLISNIDYEKFNRDRLAFKTMLENKGVTQQSLYGRMAEWDKRNMENYKPDPQDPLRVEKRPKQFTIARDGSKTPLYYKDNLSKLSPVQLKYYHAIMNLKNALDLMLPNGYTHLHNAIHVRTDFTEAIMQHADNPKVFAKVVGQQIKDRFMDAEHDAEYAQYLGSDGKLYDPVDRKTQRKVVTDFSGQEVKQIPIYFTRKLQNMDRLSTDFTGTMMAYAAMAVNYKEMSNAVDLFELFRDHFYRRQIKKKSGSRQLIDQVKVAGEVYESNQTISGDQARAVQRLNNYLDSNLYGQYKMREGSIKIGQSEYNKAKLLDELRNYTTHVGLGVNIFSGIGNIAMGKLQMFLEAFGGEHYNMKDSIKAETDYWKLVPESIAESNSTIKTNKLDLLIDKFNALDDYSSRVSRGAYHKSAVARMAGKFSMMMHMAGGEHYIRSKNMLAHLNAIKVKDSTGREMSLTDAYEVIDDVRDGIKVGAKLKLKDGITNLDGSEVSIDQLAKTRLHIMRASKYITVNINPMDRADLQRYAMGRLIMQFRGWIPAHFNRRFAKGFHDANLHQEVEGFYRSTARFGLELAKSFRKFDFNVKTNWKNLNAHERANVRKAGLEMAVFAALSGLVSLFGSVKDKESAWVEKMLLYQAYRLRLQTGISTPLNINFYDNIITMMQSPVAAANIGDTALNSLKFWNLFQTVEGGRYKGDNKYLRDMYHAIPYLPAIHKAIDLNNDSYMFNIWR